MLLASKSSVRAATSASMVFVLVIRTRKPCFVSRPGRALLASTFLVGCATLLASSTPLGAVLGFRALTVVFPLV